MKLLSCKYFYLNVNRKEIYFIWMWLKSSRVELEEQVKKLANYAAMFHHEIGCYNMIYFLKHKAAYF